MTHPIRPTLAALLFCALASSAGGSADTVHRADGQVRAAGSGPAAGGPFQLESRIAPRRSPQGEGYVLTPPGFPSPDGEAVSGALCFCGGLIFADDFESGDTDAWSLP